MVGIDADRKLYRFEVIVQKIAHERVVAGHVTRSSQSQIHPRSVYFQPFFAVTIVRKDFVNFVPECFSVIGVNEVR
jgi:hypothetical protein